MTEFFLQAGLCVLLGFFGKVSAKTWCFGGQIVVICVVNVVLKAAMFRALKNVTHILDLFGGFPFLDFARSRRICGHRVLVVAGHQRTLVDGSKLYSNWLESKLLRSMLSCYPVANESNP